MRKKVRETWTEKHRNVVKKIFLEGGWTQKKLFSIGWTDISRCQVCHMEEGTKTHRLYYCPEWHEVRRDFPEAFRKCEQKSEDFQRQSGDGKPVLSRNFLMTAIGIEVTSA